MTTPQGADAGTAVLPTDRLWDPDETAAYLHIPPSTLHYLVARGRGPVRYRIGKHDRYDPDEVRAWLRSQTVPTTKRNGR